MKKKRLHHFSRTPVPKLSRKNKDYGNIILAVFVFMFSVMVSLVVNELGKKNKLKRMEFERSYKTMPSEKELNKIESDSICPSID